MAIETQNGYPSIRITAGERVLRKAAELVPYEGNPRRHGEKQMQALRRSLREFGFLRPLLIDRENRLVAGQAVLQAAHGRGDGCGAVYPGRRTDGGAAAGVYPGGQPPGPSWPSGTGRPCGWSSRPSTTWASTWS